MDRGENLFDQNWVEKWKRRVRENCLSYRFRTNEPSLENARIYGVYLFGWRADDVDIWGRRMDLLNPLWAEQSIEELRSTAGDSVPRMIR